MGPHVAQFHIFLASIAYTGYRLQIMTNDLRFFIAKWKPVTESMKFIVATKELMEAWGSLNIPIWHFFLVPKNNNNKKVGLFSQK